VIDAARWLSVLLVLVTMGWPETLAAQSPAYPATPRGDVVDDYFGTRVPDPYRWLEEAASPATVAWVQSQNTFASRYLADLPGRAAIGRRLEALSSFSRTEIPWEAGGRLFYVEDDGLRQQPALFAQTGLRGAGRIVLDPDRMSPDGTTAFRDFSPSPDGGFVAYTVARGGADAGEIHVRSVASGRDVGDVLTNAGGEVCWTPDSRGFFYRRRSRAGAGGSGFQLLHHLLSRPQSEDRRIHEWTGYAWVYCMLSNDGRRAIAVAEGAGGDWLGTMDLGDPKHPRVRAPLVRLLADREARHQPMGSSGSVLYVRTNLDAPRWRVIAVDMAQGAKAIPRTVVAEAAETIERGIVAGDRLVLQYLADARSRLLLFTREGRPAGEVALPGTGAIGWFEGGSSRSFFYSFRSFLVPTTVYRHDPESGASVPFRPAGIPFDAGAFETRQVFATSKDGTRIPMFLTARKDLRRDGAAPVLLTGYGGYGASLSPTYEPDVPLWLEMGGIYAVANLRGGGEYGDGWHRAGMLEKKQNTFDDFIAAAEYLVAERYTTSSKLAIYGHSNGGLLIGAVTTQRPDLFAVAIGNAGHYDMLRYHRFTVASAWIPEYGSSDDPAAFRWLFAYSPLHRVSKGACYPATLLLAADHDDRVVPSHSYKFAAALQAAQSCDRPVLLRVETDASHSYSSRRAQISERSDMWAFTAARLGVPVRAAGRQD
jgi:prolyl oligopeptidase